MNGVVCLRLDLAIAGGSVCSCLMLYEGELCVDHVCANLQE